MKTSNEEICCPRFDPKPWENQRIQWHEKRFIKDTVLTFFFMPLNFGSAMRRMDKKIRASGGHCIDNLTLSEHNSRWKMNLFSAVDKEITGADNVLLSGEFYTKVYEGSFKDTGNWVNDFQHSLKAQNLDFDRLFLWYTTCPKCTKKYGENYVVLLGKLK